MKKYLTLANILTVVSLVAGTIAFYKYADAMSYTSIATGAAAFIVSL